MSVSVEITTFDVIKMLCSKRSLSLLKLEAFLRPLRRLARISAKTARSDEVGAHRPRP